MQVHDFSMSLLRWENMQTICYLSIYLLELFIYLLLSCFFITENGKYTYYFNFSITNCYIKIEEVWMTFLLLCYFLFHNNHLKGFIKDPKLDAFVG